MLTLMMTIVGFISGMYVSTQIERSINRNIKKETYVDFVKKHYKKKK
jgi:hypothetical protein